MKRIGAALLVVACAGCGTARTYDGPKRDSDEVARISGDFVVTAGAPVTVILRQVDGHDLSVGQSSVEVLPGTHRLLVDCRIAETHSVTRHDIETEVSAGRHYRLAAETGPGLRGCTNVTVEDAN
jgi:hypothetical protein